MQGTSEADAGRPLLAVSARMFRELGSRTFVQGSGAVIRQRWLTLGELSRPRRSGLVAFAGTQYPGNLGTIVLLEATSDPYVPAAVRASVRAIFSVPLVRASFAEFVIWARERNLPILGTSPVAPRDYRSMHYPTAFVLLRGNEGRGLAPEQLALCDNVVSIPMTGRCDSLNLAVEASVILYEALAQRKQVEESMEDCPDG